MTTTNTPATAKPASLLATYAAENGMNGQAMYDALAQTIFPSPRDATPERVHALLVVAREYGLNPFTRELYAFPAKGKGIVPIVSVDGWMKLVNGNPACEGVELEVEFEPDGKTPISATCRIHRKGWKNPVQITEFVHEVRRNTDPWRQQPVRMIRHRAFIQAARIAFGFSGIYEADEGARFAASSTPEHREIVDVDTDPLAAEIQGAPRASEEEAPWGDAEDVSYTESDPEPDAALFGADAEEGQGYD